MSRCGCVHLNTTENSGPLGEPLLRLPLKEDEEVKGFLASRYFPSMNRKGDCYDGPERAKICSAYKRVIGRTVTARSFLPPPGANTRPRELAGILAISLD